MALTLNPKPLICQRPVYDEDENMDDIASADSEDDEEAARRIDREVNGLRQTRPRRWVFNLLRFFPPIPFLSFFFSFSLGPPSFPS